MFSALGSQSAFCVKRPDLLSGLSLFYDSSVIRRADATYGDRSLLGMSRTELGQVSGNGSCPERPPSLLPSGRVKRGFSDVPVSMVSVSLY